MGLEVLDAATKKKTLVSRSRPVIGHVPRSTGKEASHVKKTWQGEGQQIQCLPCEHEGLCRPRTGMAVCVNKSSDGGMGGAKSSSFPEIAGQLSQLVNSGFAERPPSQKLR